MSSRSTQEPVAAVSTLTTDIAGVIRGYERMMEQADAELQPHVQQLHDMHVNHAARLVECLADSGGKPDDPGSLMGAVHAAVDSADDWFKAGRGSARDAIIKGEETLIGRYGEAADKTQVLPDLHDMLVEQREELRTHVNSLKDD